MATAVSQDDNHDDSTDDSDAELWACAPRAAGDMDLVRKTLRGIAANTDDDGAKGFGRHAQSIRIGRVLWESPPLTAPEVRDIEEPAFDDGRFPSSEHLRKIS